MTGIDADTWIEDLVRQLPESVDVLFRHGVRCIRCGEPVWGTVGDAMRERGLTAVEAEAVLAELRSLRPPPSG